MTFKSSTAQYIIGIGDQENYWRNNILRVDRLFKEEADVLRLIPGCIAHPHSEVMWTVAMDRQTFAGFKLYYQSSMEALSIVEFMSIISNV